MENMYEEFKVELHKINLGEDPNPLNVAKIHNVDPEISLHAMVEVVKPRSMRVIVKVENCLLVVLIYLGSTHNFLELNASKKLS